MVAVRRIVFGVEQRRHLIRRDLGPHILKVDQDRQATHLSLVQVAALQPAFIGAIDLKACSRGPHAAKPDVELGIAHIRDLFEV